MEKQPLWTKEFMGMSMSSFFQYMAHYALIAALPVFVIDTLNGNEWQAGLAMTFFQIGAVICRPLAGRWIDSFDKKKMLVISLSAFLLVSIMYLGAASLLLLLTIRLFHGAVFATGTTTVATLAALVLPQQRKGEGIGYFALFSNIAIVLGPLFSLALVARYPFTAVFAGGIGLALLSFWFGNRGHLPETVRLPAKRIRSFAWSSLVEPKALPMALLGGLVFFAYAGVLVFIPLYAKLLNLTAYTSLFFAAFALSIVATRPLVGRLFDRAGANTVVYPGFMLFLSGLVYLSQVHDATAFLAAGAIVGAGFGALSPAFQTLAILSSPGQRAGVATATYFLALDISIGLGSFVLSLIASRAGYSAMYLFTAATILVAVAAYFVLSRYKAAPAE